MYDLCRKLCKLGKRIRSAVLNRRRKPKGGFCTGGVPGSVGGVPGRPDGSVMEIEGIREPEGFRLGIMTVGRCGLEIDSVGGPSKSGVFSVEAGLPGWSFQGFESEELMPSPFTVDEEELDTAGLRGTTGENSNCAPLKGTAFETDLCRPLSLRCCPKP